MSESLLASIIVGVLTLVIGGGAYLGYQYKANANRADNAEERATQATAVASNVINAVSIFNQISQAATDEKQQNSEQGAARVVVIREAVKSDSCATRPIPASAADSLRQHRNKIRTGATGTDPDKPDG